MAIRRRYKEIERALTYALIVDFIIFVLYMVFAGIGLTPLKIITTIVVVVASVGSLALLYMTGEMKKARSRWLVLGFGCILLCLLVSLLLNYPSPAQIVSEAILS